jgi:Flp pilus assembly pilin Flp
MELDPDAPWDLSCRGSLKHASLWREQDGQDVAEYPITAGVIVVLAVGTVRAIGQNVDRTSSSVASSIPWA